MSNKIVLNPAPALDRSRTMGNIYSAEGTDGNSPRFYQDGHYFTGSGQYIDTDVGAKKVSKPLANTAPVDVDTTSAIVDEAEIAALLERPGAAELLELDRGALVDMVRGENGPIINGDDAPRMMAAWLIKRALVRGSSATAADAAPSTREQQDLIDPAATAEEPPAE